MNDENDKSGDGLAKGAFKRLGKLTSMAGKVASSYAGSKIKSKFAKDSDEELFKTHLKNAKRLVETLGDLKGVAMKAGQVLSMQEEILPREVTQVLSKLQKSAPPMSYDLIKQQFDREFSKDPQDLYKEFDKKSFASASVGQVHRAVTHDGFEVAVKIQYPGIDEGIEADLKNIKALVKTMNAIQPKLEAQRIFDEINSRITEELDYNIELENLGEYAERFADHPRVLIPKPVKSLSSTRILTMEYIPCKTLTEFVDEGADQDQKNDFALLIYEFFLRQIFVYRCLHADPHPGNFGRTEDGKMVLFDLGCIKRFPKDFIGSYLNLVRAGMHKKWPEIPELLLATGFKRVRENEIPLSTYEEFAYYAIHPFLEENQPYCFTSIDLRKKLIGIYKKHYKEVTLSYTIPEHLIFLDRVTIGMYQNLRKLDATGDFRKLFFDITDNAEKMGFNG